MNKIKLFVLASILGLSVQTKSFADWFGEGGIATPGVETYLCNRSSCDLGTGSYTVFKVFVGTGNGADFGQLFDTTAVTNITTQGQLFGSVGTRATVPYVFMSSQAVNVTNAGGSMIVFDFSPYGLKFSTGLFILHSAVNNKTGLLYRKYQ